ncbi:MAG: phosphotransferase enzyme family protein [Prochlorococcaceae cyanobacterium]|jgi:Ser/Thr protein kinase RdoA (MazF antagonist)
MIQAKVVDGPLGEIAGHFHPREAIGSIEPLGSGNVNDTFLVRPREGADPIVLQRLNTAVFRSPELVLRNMDTVARHVESRLAADTPLRPGRRWEIPRLIPPHRSAEPWLEADGQFWRALSYVGACRSLDVIREPEQAREVGYGLGMFHHLISDLPVERLADTLEGFHITPGYLRRYHEQLAAGAQPRSAEERWCAAFIERREDLVPVLEEARARGELQLRPIHGDPKSNNVLLDAESGQAIALVDLDTVKPGLIHYDIGDCLRSCCNPHGEECREPEAVQFDAGLCEAALEGYLQVARAFLSEADHRYLYDALRLISFELGLRFFSDHLAGNVYFRSDDPQHNLRRAQVQFRLVESIEAQEEVLRALLERLRQG